jgi:hypothetical protein
MKNRKRHPVALHDSRGTETLGPGKLDVLVRDDVGIDLPRSLLKV